MAVPLQVISINKAEYGFVYTYMGSGIYKCRRCSEWGDKDSEVLWLMKGGNNVWYAFDAPKDPLPTSVPTDDKVILKSYPEFDALLPGIHKWTAMRAPGGPRLVIYETFLIDDMQRIMESDVRQHRAVAVGKRNGFRTTFYNSVQARHGYCRCKCLYEGTTRHQVYGLEQVPSLNQFHQWLHTRVAVPSAHMFNEAILNVYSHELDEHIPWHTDQNALYSDEMDGP